MSSFHASSFVEVFDVLDILIVAALIYALIRGVRRTKSAFVLTGIIVVSLFYVVARLLGLHLLASVFQGFFTVIIVALIIIFQEDLKRFFEQVGTRSLRRAPPARLRAPQAEILVKTLVDLARNRIGALVVIQGQDALGRYTHGGQELNAVLSDALLKSIFDPHSTGHDGAVILARDRVARFSCHLPLSVDTEKLKGSGTRHAAALGLAEKTDAICLVVSEERGTISVARGGEIAVQDDVAELARIIEGVYSAPGAKSRSRGWTGFFRRHPLEKALSLAIAGLLWFFLVRESAIVYRSFAVPVQHAGLGSNLRLARPVEPPVVKVILSGPRRSFYFADEKDLELTVKLFDVVAGERSIGLTAPDLSFPVGLTFVNILPRDVRIDVVEASSKKTEEKSQ